MSNNLYSGGAQAFLPGPDSPNGTDFYQAFAKEGYNIIHNNTQLQGVDIEKKTLGIFSSESMFSLRPELQFRVLMCFL